MIRTGKAGSGTYGIVYTAEADHGDKKVELAVKRNIMDIDVNFSGSIKELDILNRLRGHPYVVNLVSLYFDNPFPVPNSPIQGQGVTYKEDYIYFVFEKAQRDGHRLIYGNDIHISYLKLAMVHLLLAVEYIHAKGIIHRDIKPGNLLWFVDGDKVAAKLCDFGLSQFYDMQENQTPRVVTCWYRAPEICSHDKNYTTKVDLWSVGCVFYEMITKKALLKGYPDDDAKLLSRIIGLVPNLTQAEICKLTSNYKIKLTADASPRERLTMAELFDLSNEQIEEFNRYPADGSNYSEFLDLMSHLLVLDPNKRYSATEALNHPFFNAYKYNIDWCRTQFEPIIVEPENISVLACSERDWAVQVAFAVFNGRQKLPWYKHRIIFQSLDMFDRYLIYCQQNSNKNQNVKESKYKGKLMSRYDAELRYIVCLYVCIKYFTTLKIPISFAELASDDYKTTKAMLEAEEFEKKLITDVLNLHIYRETPYESASRYHHRLNEYNIKDLLIIYGKMGSMYNLPAKEIYKRYYHEHIAPLKYKSNTQKT